MSFLRLVEEGPLNFTWLQEKARGTIFSLYHTRGSRTYRLDILDKRRVRVLTLESTQETDDNARQWARFVFIDYLCSQQLLPRGGALDSLLLDS